jgi:hypothetical protein
MSSAISFMILSKPKGERDIVSPQGCLAGSQLIFCSLDCAARNAGLMFPDRVMVFDQAPTVLPAAECAAHRHLASSEHDEIASLSDELGFQVAAGRRARELYAGLYAHRNTPLLACRMCKLPRCRGKLVSAAKEKSVRSCRKITGAMTRD